MEFILTYNGALKSLQQEYKRDRKNAHVHEIRRCFHRQLRQLWKQHPHLSHIHADQLARPSGDLVARKREWFDFQWMTLATKRLGHLCELDILLLRPYQPGGVVTDLDNRLKTLVDALRPPIRPNQLQLEDGTNIHPLRDEVPFYVLLEDDSLISKITLETGLLLDPVGSKEDDDAVRLILRGKIKDYGVHRDDVGHF